VGKEHPPGQGDPDGCCLEGEGSFTVILFDVFFAEGTVDLVYYRAFGWRGGGVCTMLLVLGEEWAGSSNWDPTDGRQIGPAWKSHLNRGGRVDGVS
jgi:hypothetical protein